MSIKSEAEVALVKQMVLLLRNEVSELRAAMKALNDKIAATSTNKTLTLPKDKAGKFSNAGNKRAHPYRG